MGVLGNRQGRRARGRGQVLPDGQGPADITTLYAVGIGDGYPETQFAELIDAGDLARLPLGAPTNTVDGAPAADLGHGPEDSRTTAVRRLQQRLHGAFNSDADLTTALAGAGTMLPPIPRTDQIAELDRMLVGALGPALWGHHLRDVWGFGPEAEKVGDWAQQNLRPEGPLSPIRIAEQPYGLLPVSAMSRWNVAADEVGSDCEPRMLESLRRMRTMAAEAADQAGNAVGADTERLLELIGQEGISQHYAYRLFLPAAMWQSLYTGTTGVAADDFEARRKCDDEPGVRPVPDQAGPQLSRLGRPGRPEPTAGAAQPIPRPVLPAQRRFPGP